MNEVDTHANDERGTPRRQTAPPRATSAAITEERAHYARITAAHRTRVRDDLATAPRLDWAKLLRRTFLTDVLVCPRCSARARIIAAIQDPDAARTFLAAVDQRSIPAPLPRTFDPDDDDQLTLDPDAEPRAPDPFPDECDPPPPDD